jgi:hypothetical protein
MTDKNLKDKIFHWTEIQGNPYMVPLHLGMLTTSGQTRLMKCYLKGTSTRHNSAQGRNVNFDLEFVQEKIHRLILAPLQQDDLESVIELIKLAKENHKNAPTSNGSEQE